MSGRAFYARRCDNGLDDGRRCQRETWRGAFNPLGFCLACLVAYRTRICADGKKATPLDADGPELVIDPAYRSPPLMGAKRLSDDGFGYKSAGIPPGGVPVPGVDFWIGPEAHEKET